MTADSVNETELIVAARDGYELGATRFSPVEQSVESPGVVVFNAATATPQRFYAPIARHFAARGYDVYTYDYRGIGRSAPESLRGFEAWMHTLADSDIPGVLDFIHTHHSGQPLIYVGHSVGGQLMGMVENASLIDKAVTCSSQSGYWKLQGGNQKLFVMLNVCFVLPTVTRLFGYFPWKKLAGGEDLPKGAALEWASWCRSPNYLFDDDRLPHLDRYTEFKAPILAYCFSDDDWGTSTAVRSLMDHYSAADLQYRDVSPQDFGMRSIGHFGYFKRGSEALWDNTIEWLRGEPANDSR